MLRVVGVSLLVSCFVMSGCGLTLDYGPPDPVVTPSEAGAHDGGGQDSGLASPCADQTDGLDCTTMSRARRICLAMQCVPSSCGDGFVDTAGGEQCEPALDTSCIGTSCRYECVTSTDCAATSPCLAGTCVANRCSYDPVAVTTRCTLTNNEQGVCGGGLCVAIGCGNSMVDPGEDCDNGSVTVGGCHACHFDCTSNANCDDADPCNGLETCVAVGSTGMTPIGKTCHPGTQFPCGSPVECFTLACEVDRSGNAACDMQLIDRDGDGYAADAICGAGGHGGDCDDTDRTVHPGAAEVCNGIDDDCNGQLDDHTMAVTWCLDADGDGYGDPTTSMMNCLRPSGAYVRDCSDCFDSSSTTDRATAALVHPGQTSFFDAPYCPSDPASCTYDYDCDGHEVEHIQNVIACGVLAPLICARSAGWEGTVPACGQPGTYAMCHGAAFGVLCLSMSAEDTQGCH